MSFFKRLLDFMDIDEDELLSRSSKPSQVDVTSITEYPEDGSICSSRSDFMKACDFVMDLVNCDDSVVIYGDYDVDGLTSTSIMIMLLKFLKVSKVGFYIPSRYEDGYGLNEKVLGRMVDSGYRRVIAVDNGITKRKELDFLSQKGIKVLVLDHHEEQPQSLPKFNDSECVLYHRNDISAACLALLVAEHVLHDGRTKISNVDKMESLLRYFFTLAGLAVFSDCMSLRNLHDYALARLGLEYLNESLANGNNDSCHDLFLNLARLAGKGDGEVMDYHDINFSINSKLNSIARIRGGLAPNLGAYFLMGEREHNHRSILEFIESVSIEKKTMVRNSMSSLVLSDMGNMYVVDGIGNPNVPSGLSGLIANSFMDRQKLHKPILVMCSSSIDKNDVICSIRSEPGYVLDKAIDHPSMRPLIKDHGGHAQACGLTFSKDSMDDVLGTLNEVIGLAKVEVSEDLYIEVEDSEIGKAMYNDFSKLEPYGQDFERPSVAMVVERSLLETSTNKTHLLLKLEKGSLDENRKIVFFNGRAFLDSTNANRFRLIGEVEKDSFKGTISYSFKVKRAIPLD